MEKLLKCAHKIVYAYMYIYIWILTKSPSD